MTEQTNIFAELVQINVNGNTEKKGNLTYLSWAWAWGIVKLRYPTANYKVIEFDGKPYLEDENLGYMVQTEVTINNETIPMHLPVMDFRNNAMKSRPYEYQVWDKRNNQYKTMKVEQASMMDINKAIMRCLAKNLAMFGLGHYIYAGEDLPPNIAPPQAPPPPQQNAQYQQYVETHNPLLTQIAQEQGTQALGKAFEKIPSSDFKKAFWKEYGARLKQLAQERDKFNAETEASNEPISA